MELDGFTRAAEALGYTQSAMSQMIASLEDELSIKLLIRSRAGARLTLEGAELYPPGGAAGLPVPGRAGEDRRNQGAGIGPDSYRSDLQRFRPLASGDVEDLPGVVSGGRVRPASGRLFAVSGVD